MGEWDFALNSALAEPETDEDVVTSAFHSATKSSGEKRKRGRPSKSHGSQQQESLGGTEEKIVDFEVGKYVKEAVSQIMVVRNEENVRRLSETPVGFHEPEHKPYTVDVVDKIIQANMPEPGFLTDFINVGRGMESPTLFFAWNALWLLSTVLTREAWLRWFPKPLYPNLYVLLVAPPSLCRKSSSMSIANDLLRELPKYMPDTLNAYKKKVRIIAGKATAEGILGALFPQERTFYTDRQMIKVEKGSQAALSISEFAVFLGKQQYNSGLVTLLTALFDSADADSELTRGRGDKLLKDIYVTLMGGVTPDGLRLSIPEEAFGGGFMSRVILAYQDVPTKIYAIPKRFDGYPTIDDLYYKLAWIAVHAQGEYYLTEEAEAYYTEWYIKWKEELFGKGMEKKEEFRFDNLLLRVAMLLRVQEYREGRDIQIWHIKLAQKLLEYTLRQGKRATEDVGAGQFMMVYNAVKRKIEREGTVVRSRLLSSLSGRGFSATQITEVIDQLVQEGFIKIRLQGHLLDQSSRNGAEMYELVGGQE